MAASALKPNLLISFATDMNETSIASELGKALHETVVSYQDLAAGTATIPNTQTRISFYGHGDVDVFGSDRLHFTPSQFAAELIKILTANPVIKDIDLLSCNVGLLDDTGQSYVTKVQEIVTKAGFNVNINTFIVDNSKHDVHESLFVVGVDSSFGPGIRHEIAARGIDLVAPDEFSLDIVHTSNERMIKLSAEIQAIKEKIAFEEAMSGLFKAMKKCCDSETYTEAALKAEMCKEYSAHTVDRLLDMYHFEYSESTAEEDGYFKCDIPPARERAAYTGKYDAVRKGQYSFPGEVRAGQSLMPDDTGRLNIRLSELSCAYAEMRAREGRVFKDKLSNIRAYLKPAPVLALTAMPAPHSPSTAGIHGALTAAAMNKPKASVESILESIKPAPKPSMLATGAGSDMPAAHSVDEETQKKVAEATGDKTPEPGSTEFRPG